MEPQYVSTPFGRRSMTLGMLASQESASKVDPDASVDKWKIFRALCEAKDMVGVSDRALAVLNALLSFYPKNEIAEANGFVVFPSNEQLSLRTHGMAGTTLRRNLAMLVEAGLIIRRDSPNGKRFARRNGEGGLGEAFGFSLAPLLVRAREIEAQAAQVMAARLEWKRLRERLTLCRRDITKLIEIALEEEIAGEWVEMQKHFNLLSASLPRRPSAAEMESLLADLEAFRELIVKTLKSKSKTEKTDGNDNQNGRHIHNSNSHLISELEPSFEPKQGAKPEEEPQPWREPPKSFPLAMVLQACPEIIAYGAGGGIGSWRDLMAAAVIVRSTLGVSPSAYQLACDVMGPENAATVIACILERGGHINSAGGYLRDLTRRAERGEFSLGPMLMALMRANGPAARKTG
ncbi:plasmid replication protein RepC [Rhizobium leguminosarum]|uniref:Replication initiation protein RepC n=2 Tax=Rhizobium leguminosarum TaxID=384 RepID=A0A444HZX8_RHILE|nr:plasmid replication protein RepC [Rhizobium leguminosarum]ASS59059.1 replication initiation protein RepC [Rhizobium leguminosarum bv. viciae]AVC47387.1 replication C protein RepC [Rhizobium leguminosarum bv. viciae]MBB4330744.1 replication initiation protein RepC [Rhizobium leguminosarum]MBB4344314.1 replication initiation protein RepC [Rhizobium leguminosarum]MBB4355924.1 replication initiation protein RepC [Rhizobium leguminosarum]